MPAFTFAALTATESSDFAADNPLVIGTSGLESLSTAAWKPASSTAVASTANSGHATGFAYTRLFDRFGHVVNKPSASSNAVWTLAFAFSTGVTFDSFMIWNHNLSSCSTIRLQVSSTNFASASTTQTIKTFTTGTGRYVTFSVLHTGSVPLRYSSIRHARLVFKSSSGTIKPTIGEIWLGRRRQLSHTPLLAYDPDRLAARTVVAETFSGVKKQYLQHRGRRVLEATYFMHTSGQYSTLSDWFSDSYQGSRPFLWAEKPSTEAAQTRVMTLSEPVLHAPHEGNSIRRFTFDMSEQAPFKKLE